VDIPSFSYQFSFEQSADWSRTYAKGKELKAYAERCVDKYGLRHKIRFDTKVTAAVFDANSYYFDKNGDVPLRPTSTPAAVWRSRRFPLEDYEFST
jgi:cation diffusion facilitator CzcD-associated flavoprotein CzcO